MFSYIDATANARAASLRQRNGHCRRPIASRASSSHLLRPADALECHHRLFELLLQQYRGKINDEKEYLTSIVTSAEQLTSLIDDMIDLASIEAGYMELGQGEINIREMPLPGWALAQAGRSGPHHLTCPEDIGTLQAMSAVCGRLSSTCCPTLSALLPTAGSSSCRPSDMKRNCC